MTLPRRTIPMAILLALASPRAVAEIPLGTLAGSEVGFEGMLQSDANWFHSDVADLNGDAHDGDDADFELRRAELVLKGKGPGRLEWVIGYDAKAEKWLDTNLRFNLEGNQSLLLGQSKQPNSLEELSSSKSNDFISKAAITNTWAVGRRLGATYAYGSGNWGIQASAFSRELTRGNAEGVARNAIEEIPFDGFIGCVGNCVDQTVESIPLRCQVGKKLALRNLPSQCVEQGRYILARSDHEAIGSTSRGQ